MAADPDFRVTVETPIPEGTRRPELAYQRDRATVMRQYKPDPPDPWLLEWERRDLPAHVPGQET